MKKWTNTNPMRRLLSLALSVVMVLTVLPAGALAEEGENTPPSCTCEVACAETVNESCQVCSTEVGQCTAAQQQEPVQQESEQEQKTETCTHGNDPETCEDCASAKKVAQVQAQIDALPGDVTAESKEAAQSALSAVDTAKAELTAEQQAQLDMTQYTALTQKLAALESPAPSATEKTTEKTAKVITAWEWDDGFEIVDEKSGYVVLPFTGEEFTASFEQVKGMLPEAILVGEEALTLGNWTYETGEEGAVVTIDSESCPSPGIFKTTLPEGYVLADGTNVLSLTVVLGDPEGYGVSLYSEEPSKSTYAIDGIQCIAYELYTVDDLFWFAEQVNRGITEYENYNAVLMNDIEIPAGRAWTPIGGKSTLYEHGDGTTYSSFIGKFDGRGHVIRGLQNTADNTYLYAGLFGKVGSAVIVNVGIENSTFAANEGGHCGSLIGYAAGSINGSTVVKNCYSTATVASNNGSIMVGGLVGRAVKLSIQNCYFAGTVNSVSDNTGSMIGYGGDLTARNCYYDKDKCNLPGCPIGDPGDIFGKTTAQFQSGEVAYALCNGASIWGQNLAGGDSYPKLYQEPHNYKVYGGSEYHNHTDPSQSYCLICGGLTPVNGEYQISTKDQLYWFAALVNGTGGLAKDSSAKGVLRADITVDSDWTPIGSSGFTGSFNGQNNTVTIPAGNSLFDKIGSGATVSKVSVSEGNLCNSNAGTIANCCVSGTGSVKLCGTNSGTIKHCYAAGGSGTTLASGGTITNCYLKAGTSESAVYGENITQNSFESGKVAYLLNVDGCWGQTVCSEPLDSLPKLGGKQVFFKEGGSPEYHNHNGYCNICLKKPSNSSGTSGNWQISNVDELYWYAMLINGELADTNNYSKNAVLTADITVNTGVLNPDGTLNESGKDSLVKWTPIGKEEKNTNIVTFDGQGHTISGLYCDSGYLVGLFGYLYKSTIKNVIISDSYFSGNRVGGVCGQMAASEIKNCFSSSMIIGDTGVGGICGSMHGVDSDTISNCASSGRVIYTEKYNNGGGVCGSFGANDQISNCYYNKDFLDVNGSAGSDSASATAKTTKEFASGEVAYLLNGSSSSGIWKQNLDMSGASRDETPNFSGAAVYKATGGECPTGYTNNANGAKNHVFENHVCVFCDKRDQFPITVSGITAVAKTYDGTKSAELVVTFTGKQSSCPNVSVTATGTFKDANAGTNKTVTVSNPRLTGSDAGKYYLEYSGPSTTTGTITPKNITVTFTPDNITYGDGTTVSPKFSGVVGNDDLKETLTYSGTANDNTSYSGTTAPTKAGNYTVTASINNNNYKLTGTTSATFEIGKATVPTPTLQSVTYDGSEHSPTISDGALYRLSENFSKTNAGTYPLTLALKDTNNYKWDNAGGQTSFEITKAANEWTGDPAITNWTYGENASNPTMGSAKFGTAQVTYLKDETVLGAVPTNAGSYTARFTVDETTNYAGLTKDVSFTISPKPVTVSGITAGDKTYDGNTTATLNYDGVTFTDKLDGDSLTVSGTGTFMDANVGSDKTVNITALTLGGDSEDNYTLATEGQQTQTQATISKANSSVTTAPTDAKSLYTGNPVPLVNAGTVQGGTMHYSLDGVTWSADIPTATDWQTYTVYYMVVGDNNHNNTEPQPVKAEIVPFKVLATQAAVEITYGQDAALSVNPNTNLPDEISYQWYQGTGEGGVELTGATENELTIIKPIADTYTFVCKITCGDYFKYSTVPVEVTPVSLENVDLSGYWAEGGEREIAQRETIELTNPSSRLLTKYTTKTNDQGGEYPTGMQVFKLDENNQPEEIPALENLLQYSGCSIRINGKPGIRMITSLTKEAKELLKKGELAGYTLEEYGTVAQWSENLGRQPLTLSTGNSNYAYKKGVSDPVFANVGNMTQYTNVLVWDSLPDEKLAQDILMRPYIILSKDGETVTLYGGTVSRSIGYVAQQNADTFPVGSAGYNYVHNIIDKVANLNPSNESTTTAGG